jgi:uncharacterized protein YbjT (DUF2867 family)
VAKQILLTGATGFVGNALLPALEAAGCQVRCMTRNAGAARRRWPRREWVEADAADETSCKRALAGCEAGVYLVHSMGEGAGFHEREVESARRFARAAASARLARLVYLGGVVPEGQASHHLQSRAEVGAVLRAGEVPTIELRASMIIGHGSLSWLIVRDLAARLPAMVLPRWLKSRTQPVGIDDVLVALVRATEMPLSSSACFDLPGPEILSGRDILEQTALVMGLPRPRMLEVPLLTPRLSSLWVRLVTRAEWSIAREVVVGLTGDLLAHDDRFWSLIDHSKRLDFAEAARRALAIERRGQPVGGSWGTIERLLRSRVAPDHSRTPQVVSPLSARRPDHSKWPHFVWDW